MNAKPHRAFPILSMFLFTVLWLAGCAAPKPPTEKMEFMFWPPAPDPPRIQFLTTISSTADVTGRQDAMANYLYGAESNDLPFERPYGVRMYGGKLYVCDAMAATVAILDFRKKEVRILGQTGQFHLSKPIDLAVSPDGVKYIADTGLGAVAVYDANDHYAGRIVVKEMKPVSLAVHGNELFVSDIAGSRVRVFDRFNGTPLRTVGEPGGGNGKFGGTMGLALDAAGNVYVNDSIEPRVQKFSPKGDFIWSVGGLGDHLGQFVRPKLMAVDSTGLLYVVDFAFQNVQMFDDKGALLMFFGGNGSFPGAMDGPTGICVSDTDLDLFAKYVHPAFDAQRLIFVTNNIGSRKINVYALGELKAGKTLADISQGRVLGSFGIASATAPSDTFQFPTDTTQPAGTQPATQAATEPAAAATQPAGPPASQAASQPGKEEAKP